MGLSNSTEGVLPDSAERGGMGLRKRRLLITYEPS